MDDDYFTTLSPPPIVVTDQEIDDRYMYVMPSHRQAKTAIKLLIDNINTVVQAVIMIDSINSINIYMIEDAINTLHRDIHLNLKLHLFASFDMEDAKSLKTYMMYGLKAVAEILSRKSDPEYLFSDEMMDKLLETIRTVNRMGLPHTDQYYDRNWSSHMDMSKRKKSRRRKH